MTTWILTDEVGDEGAVMGDIDDIRFALMEWFGGRSGEIGQALLALIHNASWGNPYDEFEEFLGVRLRVAS